ADIIYENKGNPINVMGLKQSLRYIFKKSNALFFVSSYLQKKYTENFNFSGPTAVFPTFVPDEKFNFSEEIRKKTRKELGYTQDDIVLLYSGNYAKHQNVDIILKSFEAAINEDLKLLIL